MLKILRTLIFGPLACLFGVLALICFYGLMGPTGAMEFLREFTLEEDTND